MCKRNSKLYVQAWCGFFHETIAYLKGNSNIKEKFFKKTLTQKIRKTCFLASKLGVDLYTGKYGNRLPRGINSIIMATVYHPPQNNDLKLKKHLFQSLDSALTKFPNATIVKLGDFNNLNPGSLMSSFNLKQMVRKPTRGNNIVDKIYTTLSKYYTDAMILPCIGQSDHSSVLLSPATQSLTSYSPVYIAKRDCRPANRRSLSTALSKINWTPLSHTAAIDNQFALSSSTLSSVFDTHLPLRTVKHHPKDKPWFTADVKNNISKRQKAWSTGNTFKYNFYCNKVRKLCKFTRKSYHSSKILNT